MVNTHILIKPVSSIIVIIQSDVVPISCHRIPQIEKQAFGIATDQRLILPQKIRVSCIFYSFHSAPLLDKPEFRLMTSSILFEIAAQLGRLN